ncbi:MAG: TIGR03943 family protein [Acidimicrobiales bacterium]
MRPADRPLLVASLGLLALWAGGTDAIYRFLRPSMRPWLLLAGVVLLVLAAVTGWATWRDHREPSGAGEDGPDADLDHTPAAADRPGGGEGHDPHAHRPSKIGWLLLAPVVVAVALDPLPLGAASASRAGSVNRASVGPFDLATYLRTNSLAGQAPPLSQGHFMAAADDPAQRDLLAATPVRLTGFVASTSGPGRFQLSRLVIGCCAGDAVPILVDVHADGLAVPPVDTWVEVEGRFDPAATDQATAEQQRAVPPVVDATAVRTIDPPVEPYEYPT